MRVAETKISFIENKNSSDNNQTFFKILVLATSESDTDFVESGFLLNRLLSYFTFFSFHCDNERQVRIKIKKNKVGSNNLNLETSSE